MLLGIRTWEDFVNLNSSHLQALQKRANRKLVDVSTVSKDKVVLLHNMILDAEAADVQDWDDPQRYAKELCREHTRSVRRKQRQNIAQCLAHPTAGGPILGPSHQSKLVTTVAEKEYNAWQRRRASRDDFPILKDDMHHLR